MSKILIIDTCLDCKYFKAFSDLIKTLNREPLEDDKQVCILLDRFNRKNLYGEYAFLKDCPLQDAYQEQEQEYMDRVK